jgi:hypothetical protein
VNLLLKKAVPGTATRDDESGSFHGFSQIFYRPDSFINDFVFSTFRIAMVQLSCVSLPVFNKWFSEETVLVVSEETVQFKTGPVQFGSVLWFF